MVTATMALACSPTIRRVTVRAMVLPVAGSVARTRSPTSTSEIGLLEPSAINTRVAPSKLFASHDSASVSGASAHTIACPTSTRSACGFPAW